MTPVTCTVLRFHARTRPGPTCQHFTSHKTNSHLFLPHPFFIDVQPPERKEKGKGEKRRRGEKEEEEEERKRRTPLP
jgi:hypothetical protein